MAGKGRLGFESVDSGGLADEFGRGQLPAARNSQQPRRHPTDTITDALGQRVDRFGKPGDVGQLVAGQLCDQTTLGGQPLTQQIAMLGHVQRAWLGCVCGIEFMNPPQQPINRRRALRHKMFTAINQKLELSRNFVVRRDGKVRFTQECPRHRQRIDGIRLTPSPCRCPGLGHQLRRDPHHLLAGRQQVTLQTRRQMPTILDRPHHIAQVLACPPQRLMMPRS